ncbi:MAG: ATP-dependent zinc metalloprotease FtsH [Anaerolineae bacterium]|nr:ATP-dependent zinc metalloprotease FtsH [Anaerolineae bacterium]
MSGYRDDDDNRRDPPSGGQTRNLSWLWILLALALIGWNVWAFLAPAASLNSTEIPYSTFLEQVEAGNIKSVEIRGCRVYGVFREPLEWQGDAAATDLPRSLPYGEPAGSTLPTSGRYEDFSTVIPEAVGDDSLLPLLREKQVTIRAVPAGTPWYLVILTNAIPIVLLVGFLLWMGRQGTQTQGDIMGFLRSRARRYSPSGQRRMLFSDVAGEEEAKRDLAEVVDFLKSPRKYHDLGARIPRGILLVGPPGTGKTLLARAVAGEANVPFFNISASEFVEMFVGVGASRVRDLFERAKRAAPSIVFVDELDAVGRQRGVGVGGGSDEREQTLNQLLVEMDGFDERQNVIIMAATNRPDVLDPALLRPGRFDRHITVGLPDRQGRQGILDIHTRRLPLAKEVDLQALSRTTAGFSGADLANLCNEAALNAARHNRRQVTMSDFDEALDKLLLGAARSTLLSEEERRTIAYHEAGHALVAESLPEADRIRKISIVPRGHAGGATELLPAEDRTNYTRSYLLAQLTVLLAGRAAEELYVRDVTVGAESDLQRATETARRMVTRWGMSELGLACYRSGLHEQPFLGYDLAQGRDYSEAMAADIDRAVSALLSSRYQVATRILQSEEEAVRRLVDLLLQEETVSAEQLAAVLGRAADA